MVGLPKGILHFPGKRAAWECQGANASRSELLADTTGTHRSRRGPGSLMLWWDHSAVFSTHSLEDHVKRKQEVYKLRTEASEESHPAGTLILNFQPPAL